MANWDVFHSDRLEVERGLSTDEVRGAVASGSIRGDDLIRPAGTTEPWAHLDDQPEILAAEPQHEPDASEPDDDFEGQDLLGENEFPIIDDEEDESNESVVAAPAAPSAPAADDGPYSEHDLRLRDRARMETESAIDLESENSLEIVAWDDDLDDEFDPQEEDEAAAEFTLSRGAAETVEELDLAAMVDVAFQLVLFFLVTATTVLYKSLEVPKPNPENNPPAAAAQGRSKTLDDLKDDFILVEIDPAGAVKIDREPVAAELPALAERLRAARERTGRKSMLLSADFSTPHKSAVLAYDAANEIGLGIAIARPSPNPNPIPPVATPPAPGG